MQWCFQAKRCLVCSRYIWLSHPPEAKAAIASDQVVSGLTSRSPDRVMCAAADAPGALGSFLRAAKPVLNPEGEMFGGNEQNSVTAKEKPLLLLV